MGLSTRSPLSARAYVCQSEGMGEKGVRKDREPVTLGTNHEKVVTTDHERRVSQADNHQSVTLVLLGDGVHLDHQFGVPETAPEAVVVHLSASPTSEALIDRTL